MMLFLCATTIHAQNDQYFIRHYDNENGLPQNSIKAVETDARGYLWLATEMGLVRFDGIHFKYYNQDNSPALKTDRISDILIAEDGKVRFIGADGRYYHISENGAVQLYLPTAKEIPGWYNQKVFYGNQLFQSCSKKNTPDWAIPDIRLISRSSQNSNAFINGRYFYFNRHAEIISADTSFTQFLKHRVSGPLANQLTRYKNQPISASFLQQKDQVYVRWQKMIYQLIVPAKGKDIISAPVLQVDSIANITFLKNWDQYNMKLVGTLAEGFYLFFRKQFSTQLLPDWESNVFYAQAPYGENGVITKKAIILPGQTINFPSFTSESILQTREGNYFANRRDGTDESGIVQFDKDLQEISYIKADNLKVNCFRQLRNGEIWFSANHGFLGVIKNNKIDWLTKPAGFPDNFEIKTFIETGDGEFLVAGAGGLYRVNLRKNTSNEYGDLRNIDVRCLYEDRKGTTWIGTYGKGYYLLLNDRLIKPPIDRNNYLSSVHAFLEDKNGFTWMSTNRGLFQVASKDVYDYLIGYSQNFYYQYYDKNEGFQSNEFNGGCTPSVIRLNNGFASFPSIKGLVQFLPEDIRPQFPTSEVFIDAITENGIQVPTTGDIVSISNKAKLIEISLSSPYYGNPYNQQIEYQMEGFDNKWSVLNESGKIQYNRLPAGTYKLLIRKNKGFGKDNSLTREFSFKMEPFFYEGWLFKLGIVIVASLILLFFFMLRIKILKRHKEELEAEVKRRTIKQNSLIEELELTVNELEKSKQEIEYSNILKEKLAMIVTHDLQSPLRFLSQVSNELNQKAQEGNITDMIVMSREIKNSSVNIHQFVEEFGLWLKSQQRNFKIRERQFNITELLTEIELFFAELVKSKGNQLLIESDGENYIYTDRQLLKIIIRNLVDNANKHTRNGTIWIRVENKEEQLSITIKDNGRGMDKDLNEKLNQQANGDDFLPLSDKINRGYGYQFIIMFCKILGIRIQIESEKGIGTEVKMMNLVLSDEQIVAQEI